MSILNRRAKVKERARAGRDRRNPWPCEFERASARAEAAPAVVVAAPRRPLVKRRKAKRARK